MIGSFKSSYAARFGDRLSMGTSVHINPESASRKPPISRLQTSMWTSLEIVPGDAGDAVKD
jgi:hypothetical protein